MAAHSDKIASLEMQCRANGTPANEFSPEEREWLHTLASPYLTIESTDVPPKEILEKPGMLFAYHFAISGMPRSKDNTSIANIADWLAKNIARFDLLTLTEFTQNTMVLSFGIDNLKKFPDPDFFWSSAIDIGQKEDFLVLLGKIAPLLVAEPSSEILQKSYLTSEENQRLCYYIEKVWGKQANELLLKNRLWDNHTHFTGEELENYRRGLSIIATNTFNIGGTWQKINIEGFYHQLAPQEQDHLALLLGKREKANRGKKTVGANGLEVVEKKDISYEDKKIMDKLMQRANAPIGQQPTQRRKTPTQQRIPAPQAPFTPIDSPLPQPAPNSSGPSGSIAMHANQANLATPVSDVVSPREDLKDDVVSSREDLKKERLRMKLELIELKDANTRKQRYIKADIERLREYAKELEREVDADSGFNFFKRGFSFLTRDIPKSQILATINKILAHLETNRSIGDLKLDLEDKKPLEDSKLAELASKIHGYTDAIQNFELKQLTPADQKGFTAIKSFLVKNPELSQCFRLEIHNRKITIRESTNFRSTPAQFGKLVNFLQYELNASWTVEDISVDISDNRVVVQLFILRPFSESNLRQTNDSGGKPNGGSESPHPSNDAQALPDSPCVALSSSNEEGYLSQQKAPVSPPEPIYPGPSLDSKPIYPSYPAPNLDSKPIYPSYPATSLEKESPNLFESKTYFTDSVSSSALFESKTYCLDDDLPANPLSSRRGSFLSPAQPSSSATSSKKEFPNLFKSLAKEDYSGSLPQKNEILYWIDGDEVHYKYQDIVGNTIDETIALSALKKRFAFFVDDSKLRESISQEIIKKYTQNLSARAVEPPGYDYMTTQPNAGEVLYLEIEGKIYCKYWAITFGMLTLIEREFNYGTRQFPYAGNKNDKEELREYLTRRISDEAIFFSDLTNYHAQIKAEYRDSAKSGSDVNTDKGLKLEAVKNLLRYLEKSHFYRPFSEAEKTAIQSGIMSRSEKLASRAKILYPELEDILKPASAPTMKK